MRRSLAGWVFAGATLFAATAVAQAEVPARRIGVRWTRGVPALSFSAADLVRADVRRKLESGLPQTIVVRVYAYAEGSAEPLAVAPVSCRVAYDLWEERFRVQLQTAAEDRSVTVRTMEDVVARCLVLRELSVGTEAQYRRAAPRQVYFAVIVELNPLSRDTVQRIRRWLARPAGGGRLENDAFFGSFVSLFVNRRLGDAERALRFRSQSVVVP